MTRSKSKKDLILRDFLYYDKLTLALTIIGAVIIFVLVFIYSFPVYLIYIFMFSMMIFSLYRYVLFIKSKNIKSKKTKEGVFVEMGQKKWLEPKKYFLKVAIFLLVYFGSIGVFYYFSREWGITQLLILAGVIAWGWLIRKGIIDKK